MNLSKKATLVLLLIILVLALAVVSVSAASTTSDTELSGLEHAVAATDMQGEASTLGSPISANVHRLISPWAIDSGGRKFRF